MLKLTRRQTFATAASALAAGSLRGQDAALPPARLPAPGYYPFRLGTLDILAVSDGTFVFPAVQPFFAPEATPAETEAVLSRAFLPTNQTTLALNSYVVSVGKDRVLIDAGCGGFAPAPMGQTKANLLAAGVKPADITAVIVTHAHFDHFGGLLDAAGGLTFPNATIHIADAEAKFWPAAALADMKGLKVDAAMVPQLLDGAKAFLAKLPAEKVVRVTPGQKLFGGAIAIIAAPGHTPGMIAVQLDGGGKDQLLHIADAAHHHILMFARPDWSAGVDLDPTAAKATRKKLLDRAATDRVRVTAAHLPFPGLGHVRSIGPAYEWVPEPWGA